MIRRFTLALAVLLCAVTVHAQTISPSPYLTIFDNSGLIVNAGCVWTYLSGTSTPVATYTTSALNVANGNPIIASSAGRYTAFLTTGVTYRFLVENAPCSASSHGSVLMDVSGIGATPQNTGVDAIGVAGATLTAGTAVYLSAGDGGKIAGEWYPADIGNAYSSVLHYVGVVPITIASGATGSIRLSGVVTGLTGLTPGANYYINLAGAMSTTTQTNTRTIGQADTTTSMIVGGNPPPPTPLFWDDFRLSASTATCIPPSDVTGATSLFFTPCTGNRLTLFNTNGAIETCAISELSLSIPATTSQMYDVWIYDSSFGSCTGTMEFLAWTSDTARATALARTSGRWTKSGDTSRLYVGSFRSHPTSSGQVDDSATRRDIWNMYNRTRRPLTRTETTATWNYTTATVRQAQGSTSNQVQVVVGLQESEIDLSLNVGVQNPAGSVIVSAGIGEDSTTTYAVGQSVVCTDDMADGVTIPATIAVRLSKFPAIGKHVYSWNEWSTANNTTTWVNSRTAGSVNNSGLQGWVEN